MTSLNKLYVSIPIKYVQHENLEKNYESENKFYNDNNLNCGPDFVNTQRAITYKTKQKIIENCKQKCDYVIL